MAREPRLVPCLVQLRAEFNTAGPHRDKRSDGWIGDPAHAARQSAHNPNAQGWVRAIDVDKTGPWMPGLTFAEMIDRLVYRHRTDAENRLQNIIWAGRIASRSWGWTWRDYDGPNSHDEHAHLEARIDGTGWMNASPWHLRPVPEAPKPMATQFNAQDKAELRAAAESTTLLKPWDDGIGGLQSQVGDGVLNAGYPRREGDQRTPTWTNLQAMQESIDELKTLVQALVQKLEEGPTT